MCCVRRSGVDWTHCVGSTPSGLVCSSWVFCLVTWSHTFYLGRLDLGPDLSAKPHRVYGMAYNLMQLHSTLCSGGLSFAGSLVLIHLMFWLSPSSGTCLCDPELVLPPLRSGAAASVCVLSCRVIWVSPEGCSLLSGSSGIPGLPCSEPSSDVYIP